MPSASGTARTLAVGVIVVATLDILDAFVFWAIRGVHPQRVLQGITSGLLGRGSFSGGLPTALLGLCIHFFIATTVVLVYYLAARRLPVLRNAPLLWGPLYGIAVFLFMYLVVIPHSAMTPRPITLPVAVNGVLIHILAVGIPSALTARAALNPGVALRQAT
jgi:hypothetical protein